MDKYWLERTELLVKDEGLEKLTKANVLVVGLGGVGSFAAEFLARAGVGSMTIVDGDTVDITNINRQLPALHSTIGKHKVEVVAERLLDINPEIKLIKINEFLNPERMDEVLDSGKFNYILDCIDSVTPKLCLIRAAKRKKIKLVSSMGAGGKTDPSKVMVRDISKTQNCFLARQIRKRLKKEKINKGFRCVFSNELQNEESLKMTDGANYKRSFYGTISYIPAIFGLYAASEVINYLLKQD
ncbi:MULTISPECIES: tRNA threonylcarbamoyladenosine dehydratase [Chryseobacterium]|jgi:tRNA A37 threonylcarbamoyladenosine dehydratase|uniref:tRNA A37 threonylcarbamoyladenosine dehydratase n=1 Tax=Chryseobacterium rhizosphaerae TaxID=395937 RepID=A0AAE3YA97_9FLAO|nr:MULTISPECIES: tRNA threonylcarbamoyladenosine dehydratase [Chryseobacterium]MDC8102735.1 tRNA threonylcarbamoyladenosine dehydratase [Chryseobacterium rhizosphaerae]MDR6526461.1 tRNA A37 threonylcarbamoyladenosine dehydratase [Chryseobacterium rhizosphaerae]MDR6546030.1 tRNA A37 threonylcarbamoyladenosine dehydratase [Chryseobacterium rhizosphaerae]REC77726.1 tRNA threonylcarbamoyladenosine dehydratase [Chryseobacterium rhizosphaerae]CAH0127483.1 tRNA threonylcarbamoyladenosine dehydratase 